MKSSKKKIAVKLTAVVITGLGLAGLLTACPSGSDDSTDTTRPQITSTTARPTTTAPPARTTTTQSAVVG